MEETPDDSIGRAAAAIASADAILIGAGAGMGVDSGLPDFRGRQGFWRAYPAYEKLGLDFPSLANPRWFGEDPALAWGFYGHRLNLYRSTRPHGGFAILRRWADQMPRGGFVFTSNVDGQFQRAGFDPERIVEVHGAIERLQCLLDCGVGPFPAPDADIAIDPATLHATGPLPQCPSCGALARPNILMFGDWSWDSSPTDRQHAGLERWLASLAGARLAVVECGAGTAIPTVRLFCEGLVGRFRDTLIRINPREPEVPRGQIGLPLGSLAALEAIDARLDPRAEDRPTC